MRDIKGFRVNVPYLLSAVYIWDACSGCRWVENFFGFSKSRIDMGNQLETTSIFLPYHVENKIFFEKTQCFDGIWLNLPYIYVYSIIFQTQLLP